MPTWVGRIFFAQDSHKRPESSQQLHLTDTDVARSSYEAENRSLFVIWFVQFWSHVISNLLCLDTEHTLNSIGLIFHWFKDGSNYWNWSGTDTICHSGNYMVILCLLVLPLDTADASYNHNSFPNNYLVWRNSSKTGAYLGISLSPTILTFWEKLLYGHNSHKKCRIFGGSNIFYQETTILFNWRKNTFLS